MVPLWSFKRFTVKGGVEAPTADASDLVRRSCTPASQLLMAYAEFDHSCLRKGHDDIVNSALGLAQLETFLNTNGRQGKQGISTMQPTRVGKGVQMRHVGVIANTGWLDKHGSKHDPIASLVVMVSPTSVLATQVVEEQKYRDTFKMLKMDPDLFRACKTQKVGPELDRNLKKEDKSYQLLDDYNRIKIISCTNDFLISRADHFKKLCSERLQKTGLPVLFLLDEVQRLGDATQAYSVVEMLTSECGILSVSFTATPARSDGGKIWNFGENIKSTKNKTVQQYRGINKDDPTLVDLDIIDQNAMTLTQQADIEVDWDEAWNNNWLCKIDVDLVDITAEAAIEEVEDEEDGEAELLRSSLADTAQKLRANYKLGKKDDGIDGEVKLSSFYNKEKNEIVNKKLARKIMQIASRREETMRLGIQKMLQRLSDRRKEHSETKGLVFGGNDQPDDSDNAHLEHAKRIMASEWSNYFNTPFRPMILTMKDESLKSSDDAIKRLHEFEDQDYDVIFLKQMAAEGWDTKKTKVGLMLSPIRTYSFIIQASMRIATPWQVEKGKTVITGDLIALADPFFLMFRDWLHSRQGPITKRIDSEKIDEITRKREKGPKYLQTIEITDEEHIGTASLGGDVVLDKGQSEVVNNIRRKYPIMNNGSFTAENLWKMFQDGAFPDCDVNSNSTDNGHKADPFRDEGKERRDKIGLIQSRLVNCVKRACGRNKINLNGQFGSAVSQLAGKAADHHNKRHPFDNIPTQFSAISNVEVAERFYATVQADYWEEVATTIVRRMADKRVVA